jgi:hypothetical protein
LGPRTLDLDQIRMDPRKHSAASVATAATPFRAQEASGETPDEVALLKAGSTHQKVGMNRLSRSGQQLLDDGILPGDVPEDSP